MLRHALLICMAATTLPALAQSTVYRCPGPPVLYTDGLTPKEASDKGCRTIEGSPITVVQTPKSRSAVASEAQRELARIDVNQQKSRDDERRRVLENELREAEKRMAATQAEYQDGNGERQGDEARNYQKYLDRMAQLKAAINRQDADIQALKREISKLPP